MSNRYTQTYSAADLYILKILKNFVRMIAYDIDDIYNDTKMSEKTVL